MSFTARAVITREPLFSGLRLNRNRYTITLFLDDIETPVHVHCRKRDVPKLAPMIANHAVDLIDEIGWAGEAYKALRAAQTAKLPTPGTAIELTVDLGTGLTIGTRGKVVESTIPEGDREDFPISFATENGSPVPLRFGEWKVS